MNNRMCQCKQEENIRGDAPIIEKKYRLADFFDQWWDVYAQLPKVPITLEQYKAVNALRVCRTAALGVDVYACPDCGELSEVYHSCRNRFCPTCSWQDTVQWAEKIKSRMLSVPHRHVVITLPHQLNGLVKRNGEKLLNALFRSASDTFKDWMGAKYRLKPGVISVLHTFGEMKNYHPHVHMIVSWGGIDTKTGKLEQVKKGFLNYAFLQKKFRCKFEDELVSLYDKQKLSHNFPDRPSFLRFIKSINEKGWVLHLEPPMDLPSHVIRYIGRYSKRACLSEYKISKMEGEYISFRYKDYKHLDEDKKPMEKELELHYRDFFPLLLQHVPLRYFRLVRYYGLYSNKANIPEEYLFTPADEPSTGDGFSVEQPKQGELYCPFCHKKKKYVHTKVRNRLSGYKQVYERYLLRRLSDIWLKTA